MIDLLKRLCEADGVSGNEEAVATIILNEIKPYADEIKTDSIGNIIAFKKGKTKPKNRLLLCAHIDEVGLIIKKITDDGYLKFGTVGGIANEVLLATVVRCGSVKGVIGIKAIHLTEKKEREALPEIEDMYIDIGAKNKEDAEKKVNIGDFFAFDSSFCEFGEGLIKSKAIDDRLGCAVLISLMKKELKFDTYFAFTVQEEVGLRGATVVCEQIKPQIAIIVEATTAGDIEGVKKHKQVCALKGGAVIPFMDGGTIYNLFDDLKAEAKRQNIKWQTKEYISGGTDARAIQISGSGVKVGAIAAPTRYIHSPSCVVNKEDIGSMQKLIESYLNNMEEA